MAEMPLAPFEYGDISDMHRRLSSRSPFFANMSLPQFSDWANQQTGTQVFNQGLSDNVIKRASHAIDRFLEPVSTPLGREARLATKQLTSSPDLQQMAQDIGESLPRALPEMVALMTGAGIAPRGMWLAGRGLQALASGSVGASTYEHTGSPAAGAVQGGLFGLLPSFVTRGQRAASAGLTKLFYEPTESRLAGNIVRGAVPRPDQGALVGLIERGAEMAGREVAAAVNQELAIQGTTLATTGGLAPMDKQHAMLLTVAQAPFMLLDVPHVLAGPRIDISGRRVGFRSTTEAINMISEAQRLAKVEAVRPMHEARTEIQSYLRTAKEPKQLLLPESTGREAFAAGVSSLEPSLVEKSRALSVQSAKQAIAKELTEFGSVSRSRFTARGGDPAIFDEALKILMGDTPAETYYPASGYAAGQMSKTPKKRVPDFEPMPDVVKANATPDPKVAEALAKFKLDVADVLPTLPERLPTAREPVGADEFSGWLNKLAWKEAGDDSSLVEEKALELLDKTWTKQELETATGESLDALAARGLVKQGAENEYTIVAPEDVAAPVEVPTEILPGAAMEGAEGVKKQEGTDEFMRNLLAKRQKEPKEPRRAKPAAKPAEPKLVPDDKVDVIETEDGPQEYVRTNKGDLVPKAWAEAARKAGLRDDSPEGTEPLEWEGRKRERKEAVGELTYHVPPTEEELARAYTLADSDQRIGAIARHFTQQLEQRLQRQMGPDTQGPPMPVEVLVTQTADYVYEIEGMLRSAGMMHQFEKALDVGMDLGGLKQHYAEMIKLGMSPIEAGARLYRAQISRLRLLIEYRNTWLRTLSDNTLGAKLALLAERIKKTGMDLERAQALTQSIRDLAKPVEPERDVTLLRSIDVLEREFAREEKAMQEARDRFIAETNRKPTLADLAQITPPRISKALWEIIDTFQTVDDLTEFAYNTAAQILREEEAGLLRGLREAEVAVATRGGDIPLERQRVNLFRARLKKAMQDKVADVLKQKKDLKLPDADELAAMDTLDEIVTRHAQESLEAREATLADPALERADEVIRRELPDAMSEAEWVKAGRGYADLEFGMRVWYPAPPKRGDTWRRLNYLLKLYKERQIGTYNMKRGDNRPAFGFVVPGTRMASGQTARKPDLIAHAINGGFTDLRTRTEVQRINREALAMGKEPEYPLELTRTLEADVHEMERMLREDFIPHIRGYLWRKTGRSFTEMVMEGRYEPTDIKVPPYVPPHKKPSRAEPLPASNELLPKYSPVLTRPTSDYMPVNNRVLNSILSVGRLPNPSTGERALLDALALRGPGQDIAYVLEVPRGTYVGSGTIHALDFDGALLYSMPVASARSSVARTAPEVYQGGMFPQEPTAGSVETPNVPPGFMSEASKSPFGQLTTSIGARGWFEKFFTQYGYSPEQVGRLADIASRVADSYYGTGYARVGEGVKQVALGESWWFKGEGDQVARLILMGGDALRRETTHPALLSWKVLQTLAHEAVHQLVSEHSGQTQFVKTLAPEMRQAFNQAWAWANDLSPDERYTTLALTLDSVLPRGLDDIYRERFKMAAAKRGQASVNEFFSDMVSVATLGAASKSEISREWAATLKFGPKMVQDFVDMLYVPLYEVGGAVQKFLKASGRERESNAFGGILGNMAKVMRNRDEVQFAVDAMRNLSKLDPATYSQMIGDATYTPLGTSRKMEEWFGQLAGRQAQPPTGQALVDSARKVLGLGEPRGIEKWFGVSLGWLTKMFAPSAQVAARYPILQPVFDVVRSFRALANDAASRIAQPFMLTTITGRQALDVEAKGLRYLLKNKRADEAASRIMLLKNEEERVFTDAEMRQQMPELDAKGQQHVIDFHRAMEEAMPRAADQIIAFFARKQHHFAAHQLMIKDKALSAEAALVLGRNLWEAQRILTTPNAMPADLAAAQRTMLSVQQATSAADYVSKLILPTIDRASVLAATLKGPDGKGKPYFMSEMRLGRYYVSFRRGTGPAGVIAADTKDAISRIATQKQSEGYTVHTWDKYSDRTGNGGMNPAFMSNVQAVEEAALTRDLVVAGYSTEEIARVKEAYQPLAEQLKQMRLRGAERFTAARLLRPGRETVSASIGALHYIRDLSTALAKQHVTSLAEVHFADPQLRANRDILNYAVDHFNNVVRPTAREWTALKQMNFAYFLGFNLSSMIIESGQTLLTLLPQLTRDSGSLLDSYRYWSKGVSEAVSSFARKGPFEKRFDDPELGRAVAQAIREQRIDFGIMQEFQNLDDLALPNMRRMMLGGEDITTVKEVATKPFYWYVHGSRWLYSQMTRANAYTSFITAFKMGRERLKLGYDQAYQYAARTVDKTMFGGGAAARPVGMFANSGKFQGALGAMYSLGTYTFSTIAMMARLMRDTIDTKLPPAQRTAAAKAAGQMLVTQTAIGGAMSLPFATAAMAVIEQLFPEAEAFKKAKDTATAAGNWLFEDLLGFDEGAGEMFSDVATRGVPTLGGVDVSSRVALSQLMGISPYDGISAKNLMGPTGSMIENIYRATVLGQQGQLPKAAETLLPVPYKNIVNLYNNDGVLRDQAGRPLVDDLSTFEAAAYSIGLRPARLTTLREAQRSIRRSEDIAQQQNTRLFQEWAKDMIEGRVDKVREELLARQADYPQDFNAVAGARRVVDEVLKRTLPFDIAREGTRMNAVERQRIAASVQRRVPNEVERLKMKERLGRVIGIPGAGMISPTEARQATLVDQLMAQNPYLPRQQAVDMAALMMGRREQMLRPGVQ